MSHTIKLCIHIVTGKLFYMLSQLRIKYDFFSIFPYTNILSDRLQVVKYIFLNNRNLKKESCRF